MSELKPLPCPFCGGAPRSAARPDNIDGTRFFYALACYCGGYSACAHKMAVEPTPEQAKRAAIEAWNRRAQPAQAGQVLSDSALLAMWAGEVLAYGRAVEQAVLAKRVPMTDPQLQTSEERRATGDRILALIEKQHPGIVGKEGA